MKNYQEPIISSEPGRPGRTSESHPAYGQIEIVRTHSGGRVALYGSHTEHSDYLTIRIASSEVQRDLSSDWHHASSRPMIELSMSESQFASMLSSIGLGGGTPCTFQRINGESVPGITPIETKRRTFRREMLQAIKKNTDHHDQLLALLDDAKIPAKLKAQLKGGIGSLKHGVEASADFISSQFDEFADKTVASLRQDFDAHMTARMKRDGVESIGMDATRLLPE